MSNTSTKPTVAQNFSQLESLISEFESDQLDLETAIPKFKQAVELAKQIKQKLEIMENDIKEITVGSSQ